MTSRIISAALLTLFLAATAAFADLQEIGYLDTPGSGRHLALSGNYVYFADDDGGLRIIDVSDPQNPDEVGSIVPNGVRAWDVVVAGDYAYIGDLGYGLRIIDITDPGDLREVGDLQVNAGAWGLCVEGNYVYAAAQENGLRVIDVSDPADPAEVGHYDTPGTAYAVFKVGDLIYLSDADAGICIINVSDPAHPSRVKQFDTPVRALVTFVRGDYAYVADHTDGLRIIDISDPANPEAVGSVDTPGSSRGVVLVQDYAFVADDDGGGLRVIDVSDPTSPQDVDHHAPAWATEDVKVSHGIAYLADQAKGLRILDASAYAPAGPIIHLSAEAIDFGAVGIDLSADSVLVISNPGDENLVISAITTNHPQFQTDFGNEIELEPQADVDLTITFTPDAKGFFDDTLTITSNDPDNGELLVPLSGRGEGAIISVSPRRVDFGRVTLGSSQDKSVTISNEGQLDLIVPAMEIAGDQFAINFRDTLVLAPTASKNFTVTFSPNGAQLFEGSLTIHSNDPDSGQMVVPLVGTGVGPTITVSPQRLAFGEVGLKRNKTLPLVIRNTGLVDLVVSDVVLEHEFFSVPFDSQLIIAPNQRDTLQLTFTPQRAGDFSAHLYLESNDRYNEELDVPLSGTGVGPQIGILRDTLNFGLVPVFRTAQLMLVIRAAGLGDLTVTGIRIEGNDFSADFADPTTIQVGGNLSVAVHYSPTSDGSASATLTVLSDDAAKPEAKVTLLGSAIRGMLNTDFANLRGLFQRDSVLFVADSGNGMAIYDVSEPLAAKKISLCDAPRSATNLTIVGDYAYIVDRSDGIRIVSVTDLASPSELASFDTDGDAWDVAVAGDYAFIADGEDGVRVVNVYDPTRPVEVGSFETPGFARGVQFLNDRLYIADDNRGLQIADVSDPEQPAALGSYDTRGWTWDVEVSGNYAYLADERYGLLILDVSDPAYPEEVGSYDTPGNAYGISVAGDRVYVADGEGGVAVIDISDHAQPSLLDHYYLPGTARNVALSDSFAFVADAKSGLAVLDLEGKMNGLANEPPRPPSSLALLPAYPNPFNAQTSLRFGLPAGSQVNLSVFDLSGRQVAILYYGVAESGYHTLVWNADRFPAGVYLIRLVAGRESAVTRAVVLK